MGWTASEDGIDFERSGCCFLYLSKGSSGGSDSVIWQVVFDRRGWTLLTVGENSHWKKHPSRLTCHDC